MIFFNLLKISLRTVLSLAPKSIDTNQVYSSGILFNDHHSPPNNWQLREMYSKESGINHRYFYHPGPTSDAPVFLFLHGLFLDGRGFERMLSLSQRWQLIAYDFPESSQAYRGDLNDFKYLLDDFLDALKIDDIYLCGVSFGGIIALRYAASHARRIKALILISTFIVNLTHEDRIKSGEIAKTLLMHSDDKLRWMIKQLITFSFSNKQSSQNVVKAILRLRNINWYKQFVRSITTCEGFEDAVQVKCPVLVLNGEHDRAVSGNSARLITLHIPHAEFQMIEEGTHSMMLLKGEMLAKRIFSFCNK